MTAEPFFASTGRPTVRVERHYPHPIEKVWRAVTTPEHLRAWFPSPVEIDLRVGGAMTFTAFDGDAASAGRVEMLDPPRLLAFRWGADRLTFELAATADGTSFALTHAFDDRAGAPSFASGWEMCLGALRRVLAGEPAPAPDRGVARHEELVVAFGLDRPEVTEDATGWTVRFERQLTCPPPVARDLWSGPDQDTGEHVRLELGEGTGHGARIVLTVSGTDPAERDAAIERWGGAVGHLAREAALAAAVG